MAGPGTVADGVQVVEQDIEMYLHWILETTK